MVHTSPSRGIMYSAPPNEDGDRTADDAKHPPETEATDTPDREANEPEPASADAQRDPRTVTQGTDANWTGTVPAGD